MIGAVALLETLTKSGVDVTFGNPGTSEMHFVAALDRVLELVDSLSGDGIRLEYVDIGGGFGISYDGTEDLDLPVLAEQVVPHS